MEDEDGEEQPRADIGVGAAVPPRNSDHSVGAPRGDVAERAPRGAGPATEWQAFCFIAVYRPAGSRRSDERGLAGL